MQECPECKSRSVMIKDGSKRCQAKGCTFVEFHVITNQNENRQYEGEKGTENRFSSTSFNSYNREKESERYEKNFYRAANVVKELIRTMKLSTHLQEKAESKLIKILKIKYPEEKNETQDKDGMKQKQRKQKQRKQQKITVPDQKIGAYCLWLACCDKKMEFKDVRIANQMGISKAEWADIHTKMEKRFNSIIDIPPVNPEQYIRRICRKRKINQIEQKAMLEMAKNIKQAQIKGGKKNATVAACIFWQIMIRSSTYNKDGSFDIKQYLEKGGRNNEDESNQKYWTQTQFDIAYDSIRKFKNEEIGHNLESFIPQFKTRMAIVEDKQGKSLQDKGRN